jgi:hypothetical protein
VKSLSVVVATVFAVILAFSVAPRAFANDMNTVLVPQSDKGEGSFVGVKNIKLTYAEGSAIAKAFGNNDTRVDFTLNGTLSSTDNGIANVIVAFNKGLLAGGSPATASSMGLSYTAVIKPGPTSTLISYKIQLTPVLEKFVLSSQNNAQIVDLEWRRVLVTEPMVVKAPDPHIGQLDISKPIGLIQALYPDVAKQLESSQVAAMFDEPILDFRKFNQSMDTWHFLFDPTGSLVQSSGVFKESSGARVVSIFSLGESSFREGTFVADEKDAQANISGSDVKFHSQVPAPSGQIQIAGFAKLDVSQKDSEFAAVTKDAPEGTTTATGSFPIQVLLVLGGMMGAVAVFVLWKARK